MTIRWVVIAAGFSIAVLAPAFGADTPRPAVVHTLCPEALMLATYDANHDGVVTRQELEDGLKRDFAALDTAGTGKLTPDQIRAENTRRRQVYGAKYSPLIDWNNDGFLTYEEFAKPILTIFAQFDKNGDGLIKGTELEACGATDSPAEGKAKVKKLRTKPATKAATGATQNDPPQPQASP